MKAWMNRQYRRMFVLGRKMNEDEKGNAAIEYSLIAALVGVAAIVSTAAVGSGVSNALKYAGCQLERANPTSTATTCTWGA